MLVNLKRNWFAPGGRRFRKGKDVKVPAALRAALPKDAVVVSVEAGEDAEAPKEAVKGGSTLRDLDAVRAAGEAEDKVREEAQKLFEDADAEDARATQEALDRAQEQRERKAAEFRKQLAEDKDEGEPALRPRGTKRRAGK